MSDVSILAGGDALKIERNLLKDQVADLLRDHIMRGNILQGTKVVEREIADVLDISHGAVKTANYRAYQRLRELLGEPDHD